MSKGNNSLKHMGVGIATGVAIGTAIGSAMGNIGVGIALGAGIGTAIGARNCPSKTSCRSPKRKSDAEEKNK